MWPFTLWRSDQEEPPSRCSSRQTRCSSRQPECDLLRGRKMAAISAVLCRPQLEPGEIQAEPVFVDQNRNELGSDDVSQLISGPNTVIINLYDLSENFVQANALTGLQAGAGGAFHCGVEVYNAEWSYGKLGVSVDPPRVNTYHVYACSMILGTTQLQALEVADIMHNLAQTWCGNDYDLLGYNCCSFAHEVCDRLAVDKMPAWIDRFARIGDKALHWMPPMFCTCVPPLLSGNAIVEPNSRPEDMAPDFDVVDVDGINQRRMWKLDVGNLRSPVKRISLPTVRVRA